MDLVMEEVESWWEELEADLWEGMGFEDWWEDVVQETVEELDESDEEDQAEEGRDEDEEEEKDEETEEDEEDDGEEEMGDDAFLRGPEWDDEDGEYEEDCEVDCEDCRPIIARPESHTSLDLHVIKSGTLKLLHLICQNFKLEI